MIEITLIRHGETVANAASVWQGQGDASLSERGQAQARALGKRLDPSDYDLVLSSDLVRTLQTCELAGLEPEPDIGWREMNIGEWEGLTRDEVYAAFPGEIERMMAGEQVKMGGGETWGAFGARIDDALRLLLARCEDGMKVLVMAHGGVIHSVLSGRLRFRERGRPWPIERINNTAVTRLRIGADGFVLDMLNDSSHDTWDLPTDAPGSIVSLVTHGETKADGAHPWHHRADMALSTVGEREAGELAEVYEWPRPRRIYSSPLERARASADVYASRHGLGPVVELAGVAEAGVGRWEGLSLADVEAQYPDEYDAVFRCGVDVPKGGTGERFADVADRMVEAVGEVAGSNPEGGAVIFTHGSSIWHLAARIFGLSWAEKGHLSPPGALSVAHVRAGAGAPVLIDYNVTP